MLEIQLIQRAGDKDLDGWDMVFGLLLISCKGGTMKRNKRKAARNAARKVAPGRAVANRNYKSSIFEMIFRDRRKLMEQIQKKLAKGRTPERIAEELEEPLSEVMRIIGTRV